MNNGPAVATNSRLDFNFDYTYNQRYKIYNFFSKIESSFCITFDLSVIFFFRFIHLLYFNI